MFQYPVTKVIDYRDRWAELEGSSKPFAIIVSAYLKTLETEGNVQERYRWKKHFLLELYQRGMKREVILKVYKFVDWIMFLPKELNKEIHAAVKSIEEAQKMPYITTAEQIGREEGLAQGLAAILEIKFGEAGQRLGERAYQIEDFETLKNMMTKLKGIKSLPEAEKLFDEIELPVS